MAPERRLKLSLDTHDVVFRRKHRDGQKLLVHGEVVLCTQVPTAIQSVKVSFNGVRKVHWLTNTLQPQPVRQKDVIFSQDRFLYVFVKGTAVSNKAAPGLYAWPFAFTLPSSLPESISWLPLDTYIRYSICAEVNIGTRLFTRTLRTSESLRLIKSPSFFIDELELAPDITQQIVHIALPSAAKLDATVTLPQPYQPTDNGGGILETTFALTPSLGPTTTTITSTPSPGPPSPHRTITLALELLQNIHLVVTDKRGEPHRGTKCVRSVAKVSRSVMESEWKEKVAAVAAERAAEELATVATAAVDDGCCGVDGLMRRSIDGKSGGSGDAGGASGSGGSVSSSSNSNSNTPPTACFDLTLPLPMAPYALVQSVHEGEKIRVRYTLRATVRVEEEGPAGTTKEEESANLFPKLFMPVCERHDSVVSSTSSACETDIVDECGVVTSLPSYGEHLFDTYYCWDARGLRADDIPHSRNPVGTAACCGP